LWKKYKACIYAKISSGYRKAGITLWEDNYIVNANSEVRVGTQWNRYDPVMSLTAHVCK